MCIGTGVFQRCLIVVRCLGQSAGPGVVLVTVVGLIFTRFTVSIGVTQYRQEEKISSLIQRADQAMYQSKQAGRNLVSSIFENPAQ